MIDVENEVYTRIVDVLRTEFPGINTASEYVRSPSAFPHVSITQSDSYPTPGKQDGGLLENMVTAMFEANVYSNRSSGRKSECKRIMNTIDTLLYAMNFRRLAMTPVPNMEDATIYRLTSRYVVVTDGKHFYRR